MKPQKFQALYNHGVSKQKTTFFSKLRNALMAALASGLMVPDSQAVSQQPVESQLSNFAQGCLVIWHVIADKINPMDR